MGILFSLFARTLITFAAGLGAAKILDKVAADKLPAGYGPVYPYGPPGTAINWPRIILFIVIGAIGAMIVKFIGKKLNIKILK